MTMSIFTPSFNQCPFICATFESALGQRQCVVQYIVMDGASTDETVSVPQSFGSKLHWVSEREGGQTGAINKGLRRACGEIVAYLNSDDLYLPGTPTKVQEAFRLNPDVDVAYGDFHAVH